MADERAVAFASAVQQAAPAPLSVRLTAVVVRMAGRPTLTCEFAPGGKKRGVGIASELYCKTCGQEITWHEVAQAAQLAARLEAAERLPFGG